VVPAIPPPTQLAKRDHASYRCAAQNQGRFDRTANENRWIVDVAVYRDVAIEAARAGGDVLEQWSRRFTVREKGPANLVTEADFASQETIVGIIRSRFPDHGFLGEESLERNSVGEPFRWIIDPLDGTANYVHGFPYFAVSIGLEYAGELLVGVIFDPTRDEMFVAAKGRGAWLNESPIRPSSVDALDKAFVVASLPSAIDATHSSVGRMLRVLPLAQTVQRTGSAALNLAYVACGRIDAFWSTSLKPWDVAAGSLIVVEAGGAITTTGGTPFDIAVADLLASNGSPIHRELIDLLKVPIGS
jgi:myo-inositol-1(or 4)-monophosphatase